MQVGSEKSVVVADNVPVTVTLPGIVTDPLESIVRRLTPPVTKDIYLQKD